MRPFTLIVLLITLSCRLEAQFSFSDSAVKGRLKHDVYVLAADSMQGRDAGTASEAKASEFIISALTAAGIGPVPGSGYLQPFSSHYSQFTARPKLSCGGRIFVWREDFGYCSFTSADSVTGIAAGVGNGLLIQSSGLDDFAKVGDIRGKIVLIDLGTPGKLDKDPTLKNELLPMARIAKAIEHGAKAVILYNGKDYSSLLFNFNSPDSLTIPVAYVSREVASYIQHNAGKEITMVCRVRRHSSEYHNVVAYIDNKAPRTIILGAHYDHVGKSNDARYKGAYCVGADDNASGTAGILELSRYFKSRPDSQNNYLILLFSAEEKGLLGSGHFVSGMSSSFRDSLNFMVNFDMIGRLGCEGMMVTAEAAGSSRRWKALYKDTPHEGFGLKLVQSSLPFSDQDPFYRAGIPVLYLTTGLHPQYHTPLDRPETLNYEGMTMIISYARDILRNAGEGTKVEYRKVPVFSESMAMFGMVLTLIGESLSF
jgi:hypothetical protein